MKTAQSLMTRLLACAALLCLAHGPAQAAVPLDPSCVVSVLNRTVQVDGNGGWAMPNVPSTMGRIKARATCVQGGKTVSGESPYFTVPAHGVAQVGGIAFDAVEPIPAALAYANASPVTLAALGATAQLSVTATYADNSQKDVSKADAGVNYTSSNPAIVEVGQDGLATARSVGTAIVTARKDGAAAFATVVVGGQGDSDGDGLPDDYEKARGLDPADPVDAQEDQDRDGLSALQEYQLGTDPWKADTDGDGIADGDEVAGKSGYKTNPLLADSDGDGLGDGVEIKVGSSPLDAGSANYAAALVSIAASPSQFNLPYNSVFAEATQQLKVTGVLIDGSTLDLTSKSRGTAYASSDLKIVSFGGKDGLLYAGQAGAAQVTASNAGLKATVTVTVETFNPAALSSIAIPGFANSVAVAGDYAYVAAGSAGLVVINISDRTNPRIAASFDTPGIGIHVAVVGNVAYLADGEHGLVLVDVADPTHPRQIAVYDMAGVAQHVKVDNQYAYVAAGDAGLEIVDVRSPQKPVQAGHIGNLGAVVSVDAAGDMAVVLADKALRVIDVHDRVNPIRRGSLNIGPVQEVAIKGGYAYVAAYTSGLQVVNMANPDKPLVAGADANFRPRGIALADGLALFAEPLNPGVNRVPYENIRDPNNIAYQGYIDFSGFHDYGLKIAVDGAYAYMTAEADLHSSYQADGYGSSVLHIGQYRWMRDSMGVPPTVVITYPRNGTGLIGGSRVTLSVDVTDDVGIASVDFLVNGRVVFTDTSPPYQAAIDIPIDNSDSTSVTLGASALDYGNNVGKAQDLVAPLYQDLDKDGLANDDELHRYKTGVNNPDTDGDALTDGDEILTYHTDPLKADTDGDGIADGAELRNGTDPLNPDATPPQVAAVLPTDGTTNLPENTAITISFNEPLQPKSVKPGVVTVMGGVAFDVPVAGTVQLQSDGQQVVFTPDNPLNHDTHYKVQLAGVRDRAGNPLAAAFTSIFTTGYVLDPTPLTVTDASPADGMADIPVNTAITVNLSKPVKHETVTADHFNIEDSITGQSVAGTISISADSKTLLFVPDSSLAVERKFHVWLSDAITDRFGNPLSGYLGKSFTTSFTPDAQAPSIKTVSVSPGQTDVPTNASLNIRFNEAVSGLKLEGIVLSQGGLPATVRRSLSADHQVVTLDPLAPLQANTPYTLTVDGVEDLSRNVLAVADVRTFTTGSGADTAAPTVTGWYPPGSVGGVPLNARMTVRFSERLDPATVDASSVALQDLQTGESVDGAASLSADGRTAIFAPGTNLQPNRRYAISISEWGHVLKDLAGNAVNYAYADFTTGAAVATAAPKVALQSVADGADGVPVNARLRFVLDQWQGGQCVGGDTVRVTANGAAVPGAASLASDGRTLVFQPAGLLAAGAPYTVQVSGLCGLAGNTMAPQTSRFTTSANAAADTSPLGLAITPSGGVQSVNTAITFTFGKAVDPTTLDGNLHIVVNGQEGVAGGLAVDGNTVVFTPKTPFPANATVEAWAKGGVADLAGNYTGYTDVSFTVSGSIDTTAPVVEMQTPADGSLDISPFTRVVLTFSKSLDASTVNDANFVLYANGAVIRPTVSRSADSRRVTLTASLPPSSVVSVIATQDVKDLSGNRLADYVATFTTSVAPNSPRPYVIGQYPANGSDNQMPDAKLLLFVDRPLDPVSAQSAFHASQNGAVVKGVLTPLADNLGFQFVPAQPWQKGALIQVFFDSTAKDALGNPLSSYQGLFRIEPDPATFTGSVVAVQPGIDAQDLPVNPVIEFQYDKSLDVGTVSDSNVVLLDQNSNPVPTTASLIKGGRVIRMVPKARLATDADYHPQVSGDVRDLLGRPVKGLSSSFHTGTVADPDLQGPRVEGMSPPDGSENVGINGHIHIRYNKPVDPISLAPDNPETAPFYSLNVSSDNREVSYAPAAPYPASSTVKVDAPAVVDYAGNALTPPYSVTFKTGAGIDTVAPDVDATNLAGMSDVPVNASLFVHYSEPVDPLTVNASGFRVFDDNTRQDISGSRSVSADGRTLSFVPDAAWPAGRPIRYLLPGIVDLSGNAYTSVAWFYFTTSFAADTTAPAVALASVADGQAGVPTNAMLKVRFSEPVNPMKLGGVSLSQNGQPVAAYVQFGNYYYPEVGLTPVSPLKANTAYQLAVSGVEDLSGNALAAADVRTFTTASGVDTAAPAVIGLDPPGSINGARITVRFSERLDPTTINIGDIWLDEAQTGYVDGVVSLGADGTTATFVPGANLRPNYQYHVQILGDFAKDLAGNNVKRAFIDFTTGN